MRGLERVATLHLEIAGIGIGLAPAAEEHMPFLRPAALDPQRAEHRIDARMALDRARVAGLVRAKKIVPRIMSAPPAPHRSCNASCVRGPWKANILAIGWTCFE